MRVEMHTYSVRCNTCHARGGAVGGRVMNDPAMRHAAKYLDGQEDEDHLLAAAWNLLWAIEMRCKKQECVDTPWRDNAKG